MAAGGGLGFQTPFLPRCLWPHLRGHSHGGVSASHLSPSSLLFQLLSKYDPQKEAELRSWIEGLTGLSIGPDFQKGLKDEVILCTLMNKLQPGSVPKINFSMQS